MKTNHRRSFSDKRHSRAVFNEYIVGNFSKIADDGKYISAGSTSGDHCCGKRGIRRDKAGAKKYVNSRTRFHNKMALDRQINEVEI